MIEGAHPLIQTVLGTLFTWGLTALGAGLVFVFQSGQRKILDGSLGFAAGVMTAASYWSLLAPAIEMAESSGMYGEKGQWSFVPVSVGFILGAFFVYGADVLMPHWGNLLNPAGNLAAEIELPPKRDEDVVTLMLHEDAKVNPKLKTNASDATRQRRPQAEINGVYDKNNILPDQDRGESNTVNKNINWRRILLLIIAITIHNIPEGLAVGVGFGAIGKTKSATFESARNLAFGIGIQNFPEGLAVSLPLRGSGMSTLKSFWYGQLSGMVEPVAGLLGALAVTIAEPLLPYALAFAAGAMIYVVVDDIIPEAQVCGNGKLASMGAIFGFVVMMSLDVGLG